MDLLDRQGVLRVDVNTTFVPSNRLVSLPAEPVGPAGGDDADHYADQRRYRAEEAAHDSRISETNGTRSSMDGDRVPLPTTYPGVAIGGVPLLLVMCDPSTGSSTGGTLIPALKAILDHKQTLPSS